MSRQKVDTNTGEVTVDLVEDYQGTLTVKPNIQSRFTVMTIADYEKLKKSAADIDPEAMGIQMNAVYKKFAINESVVGIFTQQDSISPKDELTGELYTVPSVQWIGSDGQLYQCAGVALYNVFFDEDGNPKIPYFSRIRITHHGESKNGAKTTKLYTVEIIPDQE